MWPIIIYLNYESWNSTSDRCTKSSRCGHWTASGGVTITIRHSVLRVECIMDSDASYTLDRPMDSRDFTPDEMKNIALLTYDLRLPVLTLEQISDFCRSNQIQCFWQDNTQLVAFSPHEQCKRDKIQFFIQLQWKPEMPLVPGNSYRYRDIVWIRWQVTDADQK